MCERQRPGPDQLDRLGVAALGDEEGLAVGFLVEHPLGQRHRLGRGGGLVQHGGVGDLHPGQVDDQGLEVEQRLQPPLRDLRLVGGVLGVPARVLEDVPEDRRRGDRPVVPEPDVGPEDAVPLGQLPQLHQDLGLRCGGRQVERPGAPDRGRDGVLDQVLEAGEAHRPEHRRDVGVARPEVAGDEAVGVAEEVGVGHGGLHVGAWPAVRRRGGWCGRPPRGMPGGVGGGRLAPGLGGRPAGGKDPGSACRVTTCACPD